jgi:hypothetical protein
MRSFLYSSALAIIFPLSAAAQSSVHPPTLSLDGGASLPRAAQATRTHLLGVDEIYGIALYVEGPLNVARLASTEVPKALRIEFRYQDDLRRGISLNWQRELVPPLEPAATNHLRGAVAPLKRGDVVIVEYTPGKGTTVRVNRSESVVGANHDLMLAFLDHWLGQDPVSEDIKRTLLGST